MKYLTLIRHGKSSHQEPGVQDVARPLNDRGLVDAEKMGRILAELVPAPKSVLGSTAIRVQQTLHYLALGAKREGVSLPEPDLYEQLYLSEPHAIWEFAHTALTQYDEVWICAHNPGITEAVEAIAKTTIGNIPTLGVARIAIEEIDTGFPDGELLFYDVPRNHTA